MNQENRPTCVGCSHVLRPEEQDLGRIVCVRCEDGVKENLTALAGPDGLFARLVWRGTEALAPGGTRSKSDPVVKTSKVNAPSPVNLGAINLLGAGGVVPTLQRWVADWYDQLGFRRPVWRGNHHFVVMLAPGGAQVKRPGQLDNAVKVLINNLPWACENREDFGDFRRQVRSFVDDAQSALDPTADRPIRVQIGRCPAKVDGLICGRMLTADPFSLSIRCPNCGTVWGRAEWVDLGNSLRK